MEINPVLLQSLPFLAAVVPPALLAVLRGRRIRRLIRQRNRVLRELRLTRRLLAAEREYARACALASRANAPVTATVPALSGTGRAGDSESVPVEDYSLNRVFECVRRMFGEDAKHAGIELSVVPSSVRVCTPAAALLRLLSERISAAIIQDSAARIALGARRRQGRVRIELYIRAKPARSLDLEQDGKGLTAHGLHRRFLNGRGGCYTLWLPTMPPAQRREPY